MTNRKNVSVSFTPEHAHFLSRCVQSGRYQSTSEAVREGVRLLEHQFRLREAELERAREMIAEGAMDLESGRVIENASFFMEWDEELDAIEASLGS